MKDFLLSNTCHLVPVPSLSPSCLLVPARQGRAVKTLGTRLDGHVVIMMSTYVGVSLRSKRFRLVLEQRKTEGGDFWF